MEDLLNMDIKSLSKLIKEKDVSPIELTQNLLKRIKKSNDEYHAYITINEEQAIKDATDAEKDIMEGLYKGPLHGIPISIKDNIHVKNIRTTNGSSVNANCVSLKDAPVVSQLRSQGAIIVGKTNMDEFANNVIGVNNNYGTIKNPMKHNYTVGGSSGGSAVSVAANFAYGSIGTDTSGSVRIPASCCGVFGLKPTYGLLPTEGITPLSSSLDHAGILAKSCEDLSILFHSLVPGNESHNGYVPDTIRNLKIGILVDYDKDNNEEVEQALDNALKLLGANGAEIVNIETNFLDDFMNTHLTICSTEAYYYHKQFLADFEEFYEKQNVTFLSEGKNISNSQYIKSLRNKKMIDKSFQDMFLNLDMIITPTLPILPPTLESFKESWETILDQIIKYTGPINMGGLPALNIPYAKSTQDLPIGVQLITDKYNEDLLLSVGNWLINNKK